MKLDIKTIIITASILLVGIVGGFALKNNAPQPQNLGASVFQSTQWSVASTSAIVAVTVDTQIVGSSSISNFTRTYTSICNDSAVVVYLGLDGDKPMADLTGIRVNAGACYEINHENLYTGAIRATSTDETSANIIIHDYAL